VNKHIDMSNMSGVPDREKLMSLRLPVWERSALMTGFRAYQREEERRRPIRAQHNHEMANQSGAQAEDDLSEPNRKSAWGQEVPLHRSRPLSCFLCSCVSWRPSHTNQ